MTRVARGRADTVKRLLRLWQRLAGHAERPRIDVLARELAVTPRTIYRDLDTLAALGYAVPPPPPDPFRGLSAAQRKARA